MQEHHVQHNRGDRDSKRDSEGPADRTSVVGKSQVMATPKKGPIQAGREASVCHPRRALTRSPEAWCTRSSLALCPRHSQGAGAARRRVTRDRHNLQYSDTKSGAGSKIDLNCHRRVSKLTSSSGQPNSRLVEQRASGGCPLFHGPKMVRTENADMLDCVCNIQNTGKCAG